MSTPTEEQIRRVKTNLTNMIAFNQQLQTEGNVKILNAFALLSIPDNKDLGMQIGLNLLCGSISAISGLAGPVGAIGGHFLDGVVGHYADQTPPSLLGTFASLLSRFQATSEQLQLTLEEFYQDPAAKWNTVYSGYVNTPFTSYTASGSLNELSTIDFPSQEHPEFTELLEAAQFSLDQCAWAQLLTNFVITKYYPSSMYKCSSYTEQHMEDNAASFYGVHPSYYNTWTYVNHVHKGKDKSYYDYNQNNIGDGPSAFSDGHLSDQACHYMFIDSYNNVIINPNGLFERAFVFTQMTGIQHKTKTYPHAAAEGETSTEQPTVKLTNVKNSPGVNPPGYSVWVGGTSRGDLANGAVKLDKTDTEVSLTITPKVLVGGNLLTWYYSYGWYSGKSIPGPFTAGQIVEVPAVVGAAEAPARAKQCTFFKTVCKGL
tara:strand:+ start:3790 stop:5079 length:1290 start_codon:yes stop_codon:yes gene_type:complete